MAQEETARSSFLLIHGAWHGGWCWRFVVDRLVARGHRVFAPTLTGLGERRHLVEAATSLDVCIEDIANLIEAEELGLTSENVDAQRAATEPSVRRFLGLEANLGQALGLPRDWAYQVVKNVGNYGEVFDRNFGTKSELKLARGLNNLWNKDGLMYSMPFR